jgi:hypothetical protein
VCIPRETGVSRLSPLSSSFLAELWRRGEEGGEVVGDGVEMFDICVTHNRNGIGSTKTYPFTTARLCKPSFFHLIPEAGVLVRKLSQLIQLS